MNEHYFAGSGRLEIGRLCLKGGWAFLLGGVLLGMTYLWIYSQVVQTSHAVETHEDKLAYLRDRSVILQSQLESLQSPRSIARMLKDREIALGDPDPGRIVRVRPVDLPPDLTSSRPAAPRDLVILSIAR